MCGIVGLFAKSPDVEQRLGAHLGAMLGQMADRGPDSAGIALYREPAPPVDASCRCSRGPATRTGVGAGRRRRARQPRGRRARGRRRGRRAPARPQLRVVSAGERIEIFKEDRRPARVRRALRPGAMSGSHGLGHTRMATESKVTTEGAHPFSTGLDLCLVHNGSLSNHNRLRRMLRREGIAFQTENDTGGRRGLPRVAAARGRHAAGGARGAASSTSTASTRSRSARPTASRCCATRSRASRR